MSRLRSRSCHWVVQGIRPNAARSWRLSTVAIDARTDAAGVLGVGVVRGLSRWGHLEVSRGLFLRTSPVLVEDTTMRSATPGERDTTFGRFP